MPGVKLTPIQPKKNPFGSPSQIQKMVDDVLDDQTDVAKKQIRDVVDPWSSESQPTVTVRKERSMRTIIIKGKIYNFVDQGTKPHIIRVRRAKFLRFQSGFKAKTTPGVLKSGKGGKSGPFVHRKQVKHPGSKPRHFTKKIGELQQKDFPRRFQTSLSKYFHRK